jgi:hypothetical protein
MVVPKNELEEINVSDFFFIFDFIFFKVIANLLQ